MPHHVFAADLRHYSNDLLDLLEPLLPAWKPAIDAVRAERAEQQRVWNSASLLAEALRQHQELRWSMGYSENEEARGIDEQDAMHWQEMRERISYLRHRSYWNLRRRHNQRPHTPISTRTEVRP